MVAANLAQKWPWSADVRHTTEAVQVLRPLHWGDVLAR